MVDPPAIATRGTGGADGGLDESRDADESLAEAFWSLARRLRHASQQTLAQWELTPSQARALRVFDRHGVIRPSDLSQHLHIAARSATEVIDDLEAKGLVRRGPDPNDRRATLIELTERGLALGREIRAARGVEAERIFDQLSPADRTQLARILRKLRD